MLIIYCSISNRSTFSILRVYKHCIAENIALDYFPPDSVSGQASLNTTAVLHLISIRNIADIILSLCIISLINIDIIILCITLIPLCL